MHPELTRLFEPIANRFEAQARTMVSLLEETHFLRERLEALAPPPPQSAGWTKIPPPPSDARVVHVSSSSGDDANDGLSPDAPLRSIARAIPLLRDGAGDRLLLRRGDVFRGPFGNWSLSGKSPEHPLLLGAYGEGPRPVVLSSGSAFSVVGPGASGGPLHDVWLVGLHLRAAGRDPRSNEYDDAFDATAPAGNGVRLIRPATNLLIEDCRVELFANNLTLTAGGSDEVSAGARLHNVRVRRCQVLDAWSNSAFNSGQGFYAYGCDGLLIEQCVFDHNGWNEKVPGADATIYRHNCYLGAPNYNVTVRGNVIANASSHGLQLRCGGAVEDNLFLHNAIHCFLAGHEGIFRRNAILGGRDISPKLPRGYGLTLSCTEGRAERNVVAHKGAMTGSAITVERGEWTPPGPRRITLVGNAVYAWGGNALEVPHDCDTLEFAGNDLQCCDPSRKVINVKAKIAEPRFAANRYHSLGDDPARWFFFEGRFMPFDEWRSLTGDSSRCARVDFHPDAVALADLLPDNLLRTVREQSRTTWDDRLAARQVVRRILECFGK